MAHVALPYLELYRVRGRWFAYYRRNRGAYRRRILDAQGDPVPADDAGALAIAWQREHESYQAAEAAAAEAREARQVRPGSIADLVARYRASPDYAQHKPATRLDYEKGLKPLERDWGHLPVAGIRKHHVTTVRNRYAWREVKGEDGAVAKVANNRQANRVVTTLSILLSFAIDTLGWIETNPALRPKRLKATTEGYRAWTPAEWQQFWDRSAEDWRFAGLLALLTAQRGQDQVAMAWSDYDGARVHVVQEKGNKLVKLWVPCHPALKAALDAARGAARGRATSPLTILARPDGKPWGVNAYQKAAGAAIRATGLSGVVWHGLRATGLTWAAEGGASERALMALAGHLTASMSQRYTRGAERNRLARDAVAAIALPVMGTDGQPNVPNTGAENVPSTGSATS